MISRRTALSLLPAGLLAGSGFIGFARAQPLQKAAINPTPDAARRIIGRLEPWKGTPHYDATRAIIEGLDRTAGLRGVRLAAERRRISKAELNEALGQLNAMYTPVTTVLDIRKKADEFIEMDKRRGLPVAKKAEFSARIAVTNARIADVFTDLFKGGGDFDIEKVRKSPGGVAAINTLISLSEDLLDTSIKLSEWGPDAFYAAARGYVTFQFVRDRIRVSRSSPLLARAYILRIIADSESYFSLRATSLTVQPPAPTTPPTTTPPPATTASTRAISANARYAVEKDMIDRRFPKEIYLGSELPNRDNGCGRDQVVNHYGKFTADSNFDNGFRLEAADGWSSSGCTTQINDRGAEPLNGLLGSIFKQFSPTSGTEAGFKKTMRDTRDAMNELIRRLKAAKAREDAATGQTPQQPAPPTTQPTASGPEQEAQQEFKVMQQMTAALRDMLASV